MARISANVGITVDGTSSYLDAKVLAADDQISLIIDGTGAYFSLNVSIQDRWGLGPWTDITKLDNLVENLELFTEGLKAYRAELMAAAGKEV